MEVEPARPELPLSEIFWEAMQLDAAERDAFLVAQCADDREALAELRDMCSLAVSNPHLLSEPEELPRSLGRYELVEEIGRGSMGVVYRAEDTERRRTVALKVLPGVLARDERRRERFRREARFLAALDHEGIAGLHSFEESGSERFLTMEYVDGDNLRDCLVAGALLERDVLRIGIRLASAVEHAHERGIIHRDLKPSNVMVLGDGSIKVLDFGIAKALRPELLASSGSSLGHAGGSTFLGTPFYMSPEQLRGESIDVRCDVYALGTILYECICGRRYMWADSEDAEAELLQAVENPQLRAVLGRCLHGDRDARFSSVAEFRRELEALATPPNELRRLSLIGAGAGTVALLSWLVIRNWF